MSKQNDLLPIVRTLELHMERTLQTNFHGFTREHLGEVIEQAEAVESGKVDSYCPECGDLYCHCGEHKNTCRWCGEIPEDCECNKGEGINEALKEIRGLAIGIVQTADDQLVGPRDRPNVGDVISDCAGLADTIKDKASDLMEKYQEGGGA